MNKEITIKSSKTEEPNVELLNVTVSKEEVEKYLERAYIKQKDSITVPGYRKGVADRDLIERTYGKNIFLEEAINLLIPDVGQNIIDDNDLGIMTLGKIDILQAGSGQDLIFTIQAVTKPEVILGQYKGLKYKGKESAVSEAELAAQIESELKRNSTTVRVKRPVENGDTITFDFKGFVDGVAFEGGEAKDYRLTIGSHSFIPGFEEQLIGAKEAVTASINVVFPEDYHAENLKGKPAVFECTISSIEEPVVPEADDAFAKTQGFESFDEFKNALRDAMAEEKKKSILEDIKMTLVGKAVNNADLHIPNLMIDSRAESEMEGFKGRISMQGLNMEAYLQFTGKTMENLMEEFRKVAFNQIRTEYVLMAIAEKENISASEDEVEKELEESARLYGMSADDLKKAIGSGGMAELAEGLRREKAVNLLINSSVEE